jgi:hypothetical protein
MSVSHHLRRFARGLGAFTYLLLACFPCRGAAEIPQRSTAAAEVALTSGILAFEEGDYQRAADLLAEAVERDPREGTSLHWLGLAYLKLGRARDAIAQLEASLRAERPPAAGRDRVRADLRLAHGLEDGGPARIPEIEIPEEGPLLRDPLAPRRWSVQAGLVFAEDSNPGLLPQTATALPLLGTGPVRATSDTAARADLRLDLAPFYDHRGWSLGASLAGSRFFYQDFGDLDLTLLQGHLSLAWGGDLRGALFGPFGGVAVPRRAGRLAVVLQGGGFDLRLGGDDYLRVVEAGGSILVRETARTATRFDVEARDRSFQRDGPSPRRRSGRETSVGLSQCLYLGRADLRLGLLAGERGGGKAFASSFTGALAELSLPLSGPWALLLSGTLRDESFAHSESRLGTSGPDRDDLSWDIEATSIRRLNERLRWTASGSYFRNDSNLDLAGGGGPLFDYRRTVLSTGFVWSFS